jgi:hypothetical protein
VNRRKLAPFSGVLVFPLRSPVNACRQVLLLIPWKHNVNSERRNTLQNIWPIACQEVTTYLYYRAVGMVFSEVGTEVLQICRSTPCRVHQYSGYRASLPLPKLQGLAQQLGPGLWP